jgi:hypothetical protein
MVKTLPLNEALSSLNLPALHRNLFSSPEWLVVIQKAYDVKLFVKYIEHDGDVRSYIIYSVVKNFLEWKICVCSYCDYFDCQVASVDDWKLFLRELRHEYPEYRIAIRNLRDKLVRSCPELKELDREKVHVLDVRDGIEVVWRRAADSFRAAVHQAEREGVVVRECDRSKLNDFYGLHLLVRKNKYRIFPQPFILFDTIWKQYIDNKKGVLLGAYDKAGRFIGGNIYLICGDTLYYKFNTSDQKALGLRPNNILFWEGVKYAKGMGLKYIDLGSSGFHQKGLISYKDHTGAKSFDIIHLGYHPEGYKFSQKRILKAITKVFTLPFMPKCIVKLGSRIIYPFLA